MKRPDGQTGVSEAEQRDRRWWALRVGVPAAALVLAAGLVLLAPLLVTDLARDPVDAPQVAWEAHEDPGAVTFTLVAGGPIPEGASLEVVLDGTSVDASDQAPLEVGEDVVVAASGGDVTIPDEAAWENGNEVRIVWRSAGGEHSRTLVQHGLTEQ